MSVRQIRSSRGFTLVELMVVVALVGVLSTLAIYAVKGYLTHAKTAEAKNAIGQMAKDAETAYWRESMKGTILGAGSSAIISNKFCDFSSDFVPHSIAQVRGKKYQSTPNNWNFDGVLDHAGFYCLKFTVSDPQYYQYYYNNESGAFDFTAIALGDLDGDDVTSVYSIEGFAAVDGTVRVAPAFKMINPEE